jgi:hypothetical protein
MVESTRSQPLACQSAKETSVGVRGAAEVTATTTEPRRGSRKGALPRRGFHMAVQGREGAPWESETIGMSLRQASLGEEDDFGLKPFDRILRVTNPVP